MKIVYTSVDYTVVGGLERVLSLKMNYLVDKGYNITLISNEAINGKSFFYLDPRINIIVLNIPSKSEYRKKYLVKLTEHLVMIKADITISVGYGQNAYLFKCKDGSKKIIELHDTKYGRKVKRAVISEYWLGRLLVDNFCILKKIRRVKKFDRCVVLTEEDKYLWRGLANLRVISNPISNIPQPQSDVNKKRVIAFGRYVRQKGFDLLLGIWKDIHISFPEWKLALYGIGEEQSTLENLVEEYNIGSSVDINPPLSDVAKELTDSSIYAMTSRHEGFGMVLVEAMASGLPVISYACKCGPRDIISNGEDGFLIEVGDREEYIKKLSLLMGDEDLRKRMGQKAVKNVQRYNIENIMPKWIALFDELVNSNKN